MYIVSLLPLDVALPAPGLVVGSYFGLVVQMGAAGRERVKRMFSRKSFGEQLDNHFTEMVAEGTPSMITFILWGMVVLKIAMLVYIFREYL